MNDPRAAPATDASKARLRLWLRLLKATRMIEADLRERLRISHDSTLPRFDVMAALYRAERGLKMSELSSALRVSNGNVTGIVDRLVADGQIERVPVEKDRRATVVRLTDKGQRDFTRQAEDHEAWINCLLEGISGAQAEKLAAQLRTLADSIDRKAG